MSDENSQKTSLKQMVAHEFEDLAIIFLYLSFFFCALATYSMLLLNKFHISYFTYGAALINALIIAKVILIGDYIRLGKKQETKPLIYSALYKAFLFGLLVLAFHILEEAIKELVHGRTIRAALHEVRIDDLLARSLIIFFTFIPLFAFREIHRVLGEDQFRNLFYRSRETPKPGLSGKS
jgi:hypothetical protein